MRREEIAAKIDHTLLRPAATRDDVEKHCREAVEHGFRAVCLLPIHLRQASEILSGTEVIISGVVSFPLGGATLLGKVFEGLEAERLGASELDIVLNLSAIASGSRATIEEEVRTLMARVPECRHKMIVETGLFDRATLEPVLRIMNQRRPAFVKTSTGVNAPGATPEAVSQLRSILHRSIGIKAAGGVRTLAQAEALLAAGADLIGTSAGCGILDEAAPSPPPASESA
jgi:deoxyribose-phosphate aldolase